jgi:hypothetical protein
MKMPSRVRTLWSFGALTAAFGSLVATRAQVTEAQMRDLESKIPPAATTQIDFDRDIRPILDNSCVRCHGPERPKSGYRLDSRQAALKGGEHGVAIIEGNSARSPLTYYVARLVEDLEMPPKKSEALTSEQVSLLRAWIDQGVKWGAATNVAKLEFSVTPELRWFTVKGNERMFREHTSLKESFSGGLQSLYLREPLGENRTLTLEAQTYFNPEDYKLRLSLEQRDLGFIRAGASHYTEFYNDIGGFHPNFTPPFYSLNRDLELETGRYWIDVGLTLPNWPRMVFGYEYQRRDGSKSILQWGDVGTIHPGTDPDATDAKKIFPASKDIDEQVHIVKFDLTHDINGYGIENLFRAEFYDNKTSRDAVDYFNATTQTLEKYVTTREMADHFQFSDSLRLDKQLRDWLYLSGGYRYSRLDGDYSFNNTTVSPIGVFSPNDSFWFADSITLEQHSHIANANAQLGPFDGLSFYAGAQSEWMTQRGFGNARLDEGIPGAILEEPVVVDADLSRAVVEEHIGAKLTAIPYTVLFAEGRLAQESISHFEQEIGGDHEFLRDTDASSDLKEARLGFTVSPDPRVSLTAHLKHRNKHSAYDHLRDEQFGAKNEGYSAFITGRDTQTHEISAKLTVRPLNWVQSAVTYQHSSTRYKTATDPYIIPELIIPGLPPFPEQVFAPGGVIFAGEYDADVFGASIHLTPWHRITISGSATYATTRTTTAQNLTPAVVAYKGDIYSANSGITFHLDAKTALSVGYTFSSADYGQDNYATGLPLGIVYDWHIVTAGLSRKLTDYARASLQYRYYNYDERNTGGANDYTAHGVIGAVTIALK